MASRFIPLPSSYCNEERGVREAVRAESRLSLPGEGDPHNGTLHHTAVAGARTHHQKPMLLMGWQQGRLGRLAAKLSRGCNPAYTSTSTRCSPEAPPPVGNTPNSSTMETPLPCRILALPPFLRICQGFQTCPKVPLLLKLQCLVGEPPSLSLISLPSDTTFP